MVWLGMGRVAWIAECPIHGAQPFIDPSPSTNRHTHHARAHLSKYRASCGISAISPDAAASANLRSGCSSASSASLVAACLIYKSVYTSVRWWDGGGCVSCVRVSLCGTVTYNS